MSKSSFDVEFTWGRRPFTQRNDIRNPYEWTDWDGFVEKFARPLLESSIEVRVFWWDTGATIAGQQFIQFMHENFIDTGKGWLLKPGADPIDGEGARHFWAGDTGLGTSAKVSQCDIAPIFSFDPQRFAILASLVDDSCHLIREEYFPYRSPETKNPVARFTRSVVAKGQACLIPHITVGTIQFRAPRSEKSSMRALYPSGATVGYESEA